MIDVFIIGSGRSGTTWLSAIFDSHPDTLLIHEPDEIRSDRRVPFNPGTGDIAHGRQDAADYAGELAGVRALRAVQKQPFFKKTYRRPAAEALRRGLIFALAAAEKPLGRVLPLNRIQIPDLAAMPPQLVAKSVISVARLPLFAAAMPDTRFIHILRHPAGVTASRLKGAKIGKMPPARLPLDQLRLPLAEESGLTQEHVAEMGDVERSAWSWALTNDFALRACEGLPNVFVLRYEDLCEDPMAVSRSLLDWTGLGWHPQVDAFVGLSLKAQGDSRDYHGVVRDPKVVVHRWKQTMAAEDVAAIERAVGGTRPGRLFGIGADAGGADRKAQG